MAFATASPNNFLVVGHQGKVINRGTGIQVFLWPGSTFVLIPSTKQEALFEMTQETKDGIPLRFKGIVIYRIVDPVVAAMSFNFNSGNGLSEINTLVNNICLGELRAKVSGMTMQECIENRKTILTATVDNSLREILADSSSPTGTKWGLELELVQVAQVFIVDAVLRKQLEAEVRNEILSKSEQSDIATQQSINMAQIASDREIQEQKIAAEKDAIRQKEEIEQANLQVRRRAQKQNQQLELEAIQLASETFKLEQSAAREKVETETPVKLMQIENQHEVFNRELEMRKVENQIREQEVMRDMLLEKARQELRKEILPVEQIPEITESLSTIFNGSNLTFVGNENQILSSILPLINIISDRVKESVQPALAAAHSETTATPNQKPAQKKN
jgi:flotillin